MTKSSTAETESKSAESVASNAMNLAKSARKEADSFEKDITSAKTQAANAESHLADALQQAAAATAELNRIKTPRVLQGKTELVKALSAFKGTEYTFVSVFQDEESLNLLKDIDDVLQKAGWTRTLTSGFPGIDIYGHAGNVSVPTGFGTGVQVFADSPELVSDFEKRPAGQWLPHLKAALALNLNLGSLVSPLPGRSNEKLVGIEVGTSATIRIAVGKKP